MSKTKKIVTKKISTKAATKSGTKPTSLTKKKKQTKVTKSAKVVRTEHIGPLAISLRGLKKKYVLHHEKPTFVEKFFGKSSKEEFLAIDNIDLSIPKGQKVAIIGKNGSGKTTLLKLICGVTKETQGDLKVMGRVVSLIDLEAGFHPELNGYENISLNGLIVGMSRAEIQKQMPDIIRFADIGKFIDSPLFTYSEGMKLRLGFAIAVHADPDILVLDEMIATGDANFQKKCFDRIQEFFKQHKTIITVSHVMEFIEPHYQRFIWLEKGKVRMDGGKEVVAAYRKTWK